MHVSRKRISHTVAAIGSAVMLALSLTAAPAGAATTDETGAAAVHARFANYEHKQCIEEDAYYHLVSNDCGIGYSTLRWYWTGRTNTSSYLQNYVWRDCIDSNADRHVYAANCNGGDNQTWRVIQPAQGSAVMLQNEATRLCLYQTYAGLYRTATCDRNRRDQRWTIG